MKHTHNIWCDTSFLQWCRFTAFAVQTTLHVYTTPHGSSTIGVVKSNRCTTLDMKPSIRTRLDVYSTQEFCVQQRWCRNSTCWPARHNIWCAPLYLCNTWYVHITVSAQFGRDVHNTKGSKLQCIWSNRCVHNTSDVHATLVVHNTGDACTAQQ